MEDRCKVIAVTNQKGGVAKTTTTVDLGVALARLGLKVCLIDSDPQSSLSKSCKVSDDPDLLDVTFSELMEYEMTGEDKDYILINNAILSQADNINKIRYVCPKSSLKMMSSSKSARYSSSHMFISLLTLMKIWKESGKTTLIGENSNFAPTRAKVGKFCIH